MTRLYTLQSGFLLLCSVSLGCISIASSDDVARRASEPLPIGELRRPENKAERDDDSLHRDHLSRTTGPSTELDESLPPVKTTPQNASENEDLAEIKRVLGELSTQVHRLNEVSSDSKNTRSNDASLEPPTEMASAIGSVNEHPAMPVASLLDGARVRETTSQRTVPGTPIGGADEALGDSLEKRMQRGVIQQTTALNSRQDGTYSQSLDGYPPSPGAADQHVATTFEATTLSTDGSARRFAEKTPPGLWKSHLNEAISKLENGLYQNPDMPSSQQARAQLYLRLLYIIANDRDSREKAQREIMELSETERAFWNHQLFALGELLQDDTADTQLLVNRNPQLGYALGLDELREACFELAAIATLDVKEVRFCTDVKGYGNYTEFPHGNSYSAGQEVLIYFEVENFSEVPVAGRGFQKYETAFKVTTRVIDGAGNTVYQNTSETIGDSSRNRRRDYYIVQHFHIPDVTNGRYKLQLTVEDLKGKQSAQPLLPVEFSVR